MLTRRNVLRASAFLLVLGKLSTPTSSAQAAKSLVAVHPDIAPLVHLLENTSRERLLDVVGQRIAQGLTYRALLTALLLAGVRNVEPRPVGFKFHTVLSCISVHLTSQAVSDQNRWLPLFWALDYFKYAQARDRSEGDWQLTAVDESAVPPPHKAKRAFIDAMNAWDVEAADVAIAGFARTAGRQDVFDVFSHFGARDFRDIGHKAIYVAGAWRLLALIGWQHAEPILRSLAYALLHHQGDNPASRDDPVDRPGRRNLARTQDIKPGWQQGEQDQGASRELLAVLRQASAEQASVEVARLLNRGIAPQSIWDALFCAAAELLMRNPGIVSLHAVTFTNALHFAYRTVTDDLTRRFLLLQNAAFLPLFRGAPAASQTLTIDHLESLPTERNADETLHTIFDTVNQDRLHASQLTLGLLQQDGATDRFSAVARHLILLKARNAHDYKFSAAVLEDYPTLSPPWQQRFLAATVFNLRGSQEVDNPLVERTRAALKH